jgi:hypothetical protein
VKAATLYIVLAFRKPGPRWHQTTKFPVVKDDMLRMVQEEWGKDHLARVIKIVPKQKAA